MGRILAIDYGKKRTGIAVTDPLKIIASPLDTIDTREIFAFLEKYIQAEPVESIVVGMPLRSNNEETHVTRDVLSLIDKLKQKFPAIGVYSEDERFTSKMALDAAIASGMKKKDRRVKGNIDKISAALILQSFLNRYTSG